MSKQILAIFDFCETLVSIQSLAPFVERVGKENPRFRGRYNALKRKLLPRIYKYTKIPLFKPNPVRYEELREFSEERAEAIAKDYVESYLLKKTNPNIIQKLIYHQKLGHTIAIVSGGLEIYIKYFAKHFGITNIIAIELESKNGILSGEIEGIHTMCERKLYKLAQILPLSEYDLPNSFAYSDCASDCPLLSFVGNGVVIDCGKDLQWAKMLGFEILAAR